MNAILAVRSHLSPELSPSVGLFSGPSGLASARSMGLPGTDFGTPAALAALHGQLMARTLSEMMRLMLQLFPNGSAGANAGAPTGATPATGQAAPTSTGSKLAEIARQEATNGDSQGGWCLRDVGRALAKIGIQVTGASAYMAADQLAKNDKVREIRVAKEELPKLPAGAIVVWEAGNGNPHGHISIALGNGQEASDILRPQAVNHGTPFRVFMPI